MMFAPLLFALLATPAAGPTNNDAPLILDFTATWCGPCQQMRGAVDQLVKNGYPVRAVDIDAQPGMAKRYKVTGVPTFIVVDADGRELDRVSGLRPARDIADLYKQAKAKVKPREVLPAEEDAPAEEDNDDSGKAPARKNPLPWETVVRIRIDNNLGRSQMVEFGSGTIIRSTPEETIILTCAHIFRIHGSKRQFTPDKFPLKIEVHLSDGILRKRSAGDARTGYRAGVLMPQNERYEGEAIDYDFAGDVGLIRIRPGKRLPATPVVPAEWSPQAKMRMTTVGCSSGEDATAWSTWITNPMVKGVDGYPNYEAIECAYAPKQGRSGGGLYTQDGMLAGVCDFAEPTGGHGLYATPRTIHKFLDRNNLTVCYAPDAGRSRTRAGTLVADNRPPARRTNPARTNVADTLRAQGPDPEPRRKPLTIPSPDDLGVAPIATADEEPAPTRPASGNRRKPTWSNGAKVADRRTVPLRDDPDAPRARLASESAGRDADESRTRPAEMSMPPSVDPDPFEGIEPSGTKRKAKSSPTSAEPTRAAKAWQPAKSKG